MNASTCSHPFPDLNLHTGIVSSELGTESLYIPVTMKNAVLCELHVVHLILRVPLFRWNLSIDATQPKSVVSKKKTRSWAHIGVLGALE